MKMTKDLYRRFEETLSGKTATTERERWDILWMYEDGIRRDLGDEASRPSSLIRAANAEGLDDFHIDTALRKILCPKGGES